MPLFKYTALTSSGRTTTGTETASSQSEMVVRLRERQQFPVSVQEVVEKDIKDLNFLNKVGVKQLALFARQFAAMLRAGVAIVNSLDILRQQTEHKRMRATIGQLYEDVQKGLSFSEAMGRHPDVFPSLMVSMVAAGETSGNLDGVSSRMAMHYEKEFKVNNRIRTAMVYPIVLSVVAVAVVIFLMVFVMPTFLSMFEGSGVPLPGPTKVMLAMTKALQNYWYIFLGVVAGLFYAFRRYSQTPDGRKRIDDFKLRAPLFKGLTSKANSSRFTRTLATLLSSGIPLLEAMDNVAGAVGNVVVAEAILHSKEGVRKGEPLSATTRRSGMFPPMVDNMIKIGEESGALDEILDKTADFFDEEVETEVQRLLTFMEPALIVVMAVVVGFIVVAMMLPMFDMLQTIQ